MSGVVLLGLGGTISMHETDAGAVPVADAAELTTAVSGFSAAESLALVGGSEVDFDLLERLVRRARELVARGADGIVVTTGTDSIEEVAAWLSYRENWSVPVVVTGSMIPGARSDSDGRANLADALAVAASGADVDPVVVFAGKVLAGREVVKVSGVVRDAFDAPGRGAIGTVASGIVRWHRRPERIAAHGDPKDALQPVPLVIGALGDDGALLRAAGDGRSVIVVAANGSGNLSPRQAAAARDLIDGGTLVVITTRAVDARVAPTYGYPGGGAGLAAHGAQFADGVSPHRARLLTTLGVAQRRDQDGLRALIETEVRP
ncbi:asparaginase domain-containing protein [Mycobacterium sp. D16R24]|uniref:asparaginase n=1 Tax=Mycobacterium sp. D16R24 TaxID=1855656 RepID=UPI00099250BE|nr:asparaginase domain-containing protein [Mycobacterium sp. D16R24]